MPEPDQIIATTPASSRVNLLGMTRAQLEDFFVDLGEKRFRFSRYAMDSSSWRARFRVMTDLSQPLRARLAEIADVLPPEIAEQHDSDGNRQAIAVEGGVW